MSRVLPKVYNSRNVEERIYKVWEKSGYFNPNNLPKKPQRKKTYTIVIPPPNITGELHMGHALNAAVQDILIRWRRMQGFKTLWLPGTDHAGIATQYMVEKNLLKKDIKRENLSKEKFLKYIWQWKEKYGQIILDQLKKLGASCDWSRTRFTMDKDYAKAVETAFLHYYKKGYIYQDVRTINWCPRCQTSLSDLELEYKETKGNLWYIRYPLKTQNSQPTADHPQGEKAKIQKYVVVATTRPETMLGDTAVAVNPKDKRYKNLIGKHLILPIQTREIPIISDWLVDPKFGTGAVKVTPAHDLADWAIGQRHKLPQCQVIDERGKMTKEAGKSYQGLTVLECREKIIEDLKRQRLIEKTKDYQHRVAYCYRCNAVVEPIPSKQWFLKMANLAKSATKAIKTNEVKFHPKRWDKVYLDWLKNIKDWCISRQLIWGHRLPVWYCKNSEEKIKNTVNKMGFAGDVVSQVFDNKTRTYRLRDHGFAVGDRVAFENSLTSEIFGIGTITEIKKTIVGKIDLKDKKHWKTYNKLEELISAFKRHHPDKEINAETPAWLYTYKFERVCPLIMGNKNVKECPRCKSKKLIQETDVLDTWFSSALWPFATLGWPKKTKDLKTFYPTQTLSTARDIINLWVARMVFSGLEFIKKAPFENVYVHATILTKTGERMSKTLGTGIDPIDLIDKYGADATRFGLIYQSMGGQDIRFDENTMITGRKFCNKIWNATRFVLQQISNSKLKGFTPTLKFGVGAGNLTPADKKIFKDLGILTKSLTKDLEKFRFGQGLHKLYDFFWHSFCDKYIEQTKKIDNPETQKCLLFVLANLLKLLHPFMPFITEEIYEMLPIKDKKLLIVETWQK